MSCIYYHENENFYKSDKVWDGYALSIKIGDIFKLITT